MKKFLNLKKVCILIAACILLSGCGAEANGTENEQGTGNPMAAPNGRTVLTLAVTGNVTEAATAVNTFNESNKEYFIQIQTYEAEDFSDDPGSEILTRLTMEILSGKGPDLVAWDQRCYSPSAASGRLMEDLYTYMDGDQDFHREDYYENILHAFELESGLYVLPTGFGIETVCGRAEEIGWNRGVAETWEIGEMIMAFEQSGAQWLTSNNSKELTFKFVCNGCIGNFVNWETGECYFDTPAFEKLLAFSDTFPDHIVIDENESYSQSLRDGKIFWEPKILTGPWGIATSRICFGTEDLRWPGYPVADGEKELGGGVASPYGLTLSICRNSGNQDAAWEFIKSLLTPESQREVYGIPLLKSVCEERIQDALTVEYETVDGVKREKVKQEVISYGDEPVPLACITEKDAETFRSIIESTNRSYSGNSGMMVLIMEEARAYFEKGKDTAAVAQIIQNRVSVYVAEMMK